MGKFVSPGTYLLVHPGIFDLFRRFSVADPAIGRLHIVGLRNEHLVVQVGLAGQIPGRAAVDVVTGAAGHPLWRFVARQRRGRDLWLLGRNHRKGGSLLMAVHSRLLLLAVLLRLTAQKTSVLDGWVGGCRKDIK